MLRRLLLLPKYKRVLLAIAALLLGLEALDLSFPLPVPGRNSPYAVVVVARDGTPLRAFPGDDRVWRFDNHDAGRPHYFSFAPDVCGQADSDCASPADRKALFEE